MPDAAGRQKQRMEPPARPRRPAAVPAPKAAAGRTPETETDGPGGYGVDAQA